MTTLIVTANGRITLEKGVLDHLGVRPGQKVNVRLLPNGHLELSADAEPDFRSLKGLLFDPDRKPASLEEIEAAIQAGWAGGVD